MKRIGIFTALLSLFLSPSFLFAQAPEISKDDELKETLESAFSSSNAIHARFDERFFWDESSEVRVAVENGVVTLRGIVPTHEAKEAYIKIAEQTPGVEEVNAKIRVIPTARKVD